MPTSRDDFPERRGPQDRRRESDLEARVSDLEVRLAIAEERMKTATVEMNRRYEALILTMNSRYDALDAGVKLVAERLDRLFAVKERIVGAFALAAFLGAAGIVGSIYTIMRFVNPPQQIQTRTP